MNDRGDNYSQTVIKGVIVTAEEIKVIMMVFSTIGVIRIMLAAAESGAVVL